ncbi:MAG: DedA family protein [Desulfobaccales bacterium]|jgi:membrane protein DedA with SNARE-associated domain
MDHLIHLIKSYGYLGVFASLMLGMFGLPMPDESLLTATGYLISKNYLQLPPALLAAYLGSICGITLNYLAGRFIGFPLLHRYGHFLGIGDEKIAWTHHWFENYGRIALFMGYFIPGVRHLTAFTAGASRLNYWGFAPFAYSGGLCWVASFIAVGYFLGRKHFWLVPQLRTYLLLTLGIVIFLLWVRYLLWTKGPED